MARFWVHLKQIVRQLLGRCPVCGKRLAKGYVGPASVLIPVSHQGRFCPVGHWGYFDEFWGGGFVRRYVEDFPPATEAKP